MKILRGFVSPDEVAALRACAGAEVGWLVGRQRSGYEKLPLREPLRQHVVVKRALAELGTPYQDYWDVYLIRYLDGAHVPDHVDAAEHGRRHRRINIVLEEPRSGGALRIDGVEIDLSVGDAVLFEPDREVHHVTPVVGTRLVFSVGAWV